MKTLILNIALLILFTSSLISADTDEDSLKVRRFYDIEGIRVVGESLVKKIGNVDIKEIDKSRVTTELAIGDMIKDMPGVFLTERGKGESVVRFRGFQDRHIRVFVDGMPISDGYFGNYDLHLIAANNVSQIHLIKGTVSHHYGFNTMGGILNIITDNLREENVLNTRFLYSSHGKTQASFNGSYGLGRSQIYLSSSYLHSPGFILPKDLRPLDLNVSEKGGAKRTNSSRDQYTVNMRLITDIAGLHTLTFATGYSYMPFKGNPPSIYTHEDNRYSKIEDWNRINASLSAKSFPVDNLELMKSIYYDHSEDTYIRFRNADYDRIEWESLIKNNTLGFHINANHVVNNLWDNDLGFRIERKRYDRTGGPGYENIWVDNYQSMYKVHHSLLLPYNSTKFSWTFGNALSSFYHSQIINNRWYWEPQTGIVYRPGKNTLSLSYGLSSRFPSMRELFSSTSGNPSLKPEKAHKAEFSFKRPLHLKNVGGTLTAGLYYNYVKDLINRDRYVFYNLERMSSYGAEVSIGFVMFPNLLHNYEVSYIQLDKKNSSIALLEYPEFKLRFNHDLKISENLNANFSTQWFDKSLTYYRGEDPYFLPSYWTHGLGIKYLFRRANFTLNCTNLFDAYYEPQYGYPAPGREITLAIELTF